MMLHWVVLFLYALFTTAAFGGTALLMPGGKDADAVRLNSLTLLEIATLVGDWRDAAEVVVAWMFEEGAATVNVPGKNLFVDKEMLKPLPLVFGIEIPDVSGYCTRIDLLNELTRRLAPIHRSLMASGLMRSRLRAVLGTLVCCLPLAAASMLGFCLVSFFVDAPQNGWTLPEKGIAAVFCVSGIGFLVMVACGDNGLTPVGIATKRALRKVARDGPLPAALHGRVAFLGPDEMRGTPFAAYVTFLSQDPGPA